MSPGVFSSHCGVTFQTHPPPRPRGLQEGSQGGAVSARLMRSSFKHTLKTSEGTDGWRRTDQTGGMRRAGYKTLPHLKAAAAFRCAQTRRGKDARAQLFPETRAAMGQRTWMWRSLLCASLVCGLALDSNTIRANQDRSHGDQAARRQAERSSSPARGGCSNRAQRTPSSQDTQVDRQRDTDGFNRTKAPEMASCVRSGDCGAGLCCVRYLTGKRCQRIPTEGEACLLHRGSTKLRRNLGRCSCHPGLACTALDRAESGKNKGQGVCLPRPQQGQRKTRHSGKKRRTAERSC